MPIGTRTSRTMGNRNRDTASSSNNFKRSRPKNSRPQAGTNNDANAKRNYERYMTLANNAVSNGDAVEIENFYQHAEHYFRQMNLQAV